MTYNYMVGISREASSKKCSVYLSDMASGKKIETNKINVLTGGGLEATTKQHLGFKIVHILCLVEVSNSVVVVLFLELL